MEALKTINIEMKDGKIEVKSDLKVLPTELCEQIAQHVYDEARENELSKIITEDVIKQTVNETSLKREAKLTFYRTATILLAVLVIIFLIWRP